MTPGSGPVILTTARLVLRRFTLDDGEFVIALLNEPAFIRNIGDRGVRTPDDARAYLRDGPLASYQRHGFGLWLVARASDGLAVGMCGLLKRDVLPEVDVGYAFLPQVWSQGYAFESASAVLDHGARHFGLARVLAVVSPGNTASIRVLEKLGMVPEGTLSLVPGEPAVQLYGRSLRMLEATH